jgi:uncharacterized membrane protein
MHELLMALPEQKRQDMARIATQFDHETRQRREQLAEERKKAAYLLGAEPFDKTAYMNQIDLIQKLRREVTQDTAEALAGIVAQCTADERRKLAEKLIERQNQSGGE